MPKYCIECGKELSDEAKFCSGCGKQQDESMGQKKKEQREEIQESTGPAAINLKSAYSMILEVGDFIESENNIDRRQCKQLDKELDRAVNLIKEARNIDDTVQIIDTKYNRALTCDGVLSFAYYIGGELLVSYASQDDIGATAQRRYKEAQKAFHKAYELGPDAASLLGDMIIGLNGEKVFYNPLLPKKGRKIVYDAFQKVIDSYPNDEHAIEARKMQSEIGI